LTIARVIYVFASAESDELALELFREKVDLFVLIIQIVWCAAKTRRVWRTLAQPLDVWTA